MPLFQIAGALVGSFVVASVASVAWPKFTDVPRPQVLEKVYELSKNTKAGEQMENVLGANSNSVLETVKISTQLAVRKQIVNQLLMKFYELPENEQYVIRDQLCVPNTTPQ